MSARDNAPLTFAFELAEEVVRTFGEVRLRVFGTSMMPSILPGDLISVQRALIEEISSGEVVLFSRGGRFFVHRVIATQSNSDEPGLITRGDRLRYNDPKVSPSELLGRVVSVERSGKKVDFASRNNRWIRPVIHLLQISDHATSLYLQLASCHETLFSKKAECRP